MFLKYFIMFLSIIFGIFAVFCVFVLFLRFVFGIGEKKESEIHTIKIILEKDKKDDEED